MIKLLYIGMMTGSNGFTKAMKQHFDYHEIPSGSYNITAQIKKYSPDITFIHTQQEGIITAEAIASLKNSFICNFTGDARSPIPEWYFDTGKQIDITLFSNESDVVELNAKGIKSAYLNLGFDPEIYNPEGKRLPCNEIVFMGNNYPGQFPLTPFREEMVNELRKHFGASFGLFGTGWVRSDGHFLSNQQEEAAAYRASSIAINCSHFDLERYSSDRILRILGSGAFCLSKHFPGYEKDYEDKKHLVIWHTIDELIEKCIYYLKESAQRTAIAHSGSELAHGRDTFSHMAENIKRIYYDNAFVDYTNDLTTLK